MTYQSGIPLATDLISTSQSDIRNNFTAIGSSWPVDHVDFNDSGAGEHQQITFNNNNTPGSVPSDPSSIIFTKTNLSGHPYPFFLNSEAASVASALPFLPPALS